jgi:hypothetical protein
MKPFAAFFTRTRIEGLVIVVVAAAYLWEGHNVPEFYKMSGVPGPTVFPLLLGIVFALSGLWLLVAPTKDGVRAVSPEIPSGRAKASGTSSWTRLAVNWHTWVMWGVILVYLLVMPELGFPVATALLLLAFFALLGEHRWSVLLGLALATTLVIYAAFALGLNVRLPLGVLGPLVK